MNSTRWRRVVALLGALLMVPGCVFGGGGRGGKGGRDTEQDTPQAEGSAEASMMLNQLLREQFPEGQPANPSSSPDDTIQVSGLGSSDFHTTVGSGPMVVGIGYESSAPVDAMCIAFGDPSNAWCIPRTSDAVSANGDGSSGAMSLQLVLPPDICNQLSSICHDIRCYEFAKTSAGTFSRANINLLAMACGSCDEPSCQSLLDSCEGGCASDTDCTSGQACVQGTCVGQGALRFTLTWSTGSDLDLHVLTPGGSEISFSSPSGDGGVLDHDDIDGGQGSIENVFWQDTPPAGSYQVWVVTFSGQGGSYTLTATKDGQEVLSQGGTAAPATSESERHTLIWP